MSHTLSTKDIARVMKPYRARIDDIDKRMIALLRERYDVIEEVGVFKHKNAIEATLQDRVDEVRENAAQMAEAQNLDAEFIRKIYAQIIEHSCSLEEQIKDDIANVESHFEKSGILNL